MKIPQILLSINSGPSKGRIFFVYNFPFIIGKTLKSNIIANIPSVSTIKIDRDEGGVVCIQASGGEFISDGKSVIETKMTDNIKGIEFDGIKIELISIISKAGLKFLMRRRAVIFSGFILFLFLIILNLPTQKASKKVITVDKKTYGISNTGSVDPEMNFKIGKKMLADWQIDRGNIWKAIKHFEEAFFEIERISKQPPYYQELIEKMGVAKDKLNEEFKDLRFKAENSMRVGNTVQAEFYLREIQRLVPDPQDERWQFAGERLRMIRK